MSDEGVISTQFQTPPSIPFISSYSDLYIACLKASGSHRWH
jgi:hypothetical protein